MEQSVWFVIGGMFGVVSSIGIDALFSFLEETN